MLDGLGIPRGTLDAARRIRQPQPQHHQPDDGGEDAHAHGDLAPAHAATVLHLLALPQEVDVSGLTRGQHVPAYFNILLNPYDNEDIVKKAEADFINEKMKILEEANEESSRIIAEAQRQATEEAANIKAEIQNEVEREVEQSAKRAKETVLNDARAEAKRIIEEAERKREHITEEAREKGRKKAEAELTKALNEAKLKAQWEAAAIVTEAKQKAEQIITTAHDKVRGR